MLYARLHLPCHLTQLSINQQFAKDVFLEIVTVQQKMKMFTADDQGGLIAAAAQPRRYICN